MAITIKLADDAVEQALNNGASRGDGEPTWLPEYRAFVAQMAKSPNAGDKGRSRWFSVDLGADDNARTTPRRFAVAAKEKGFSVQSKAGKEGSGVGMWVRLIPARPPKATKAS